MCAKKRGYHKGTTGKTPSPHRAPLDYYGQLVMSDTCYGFPKSFPHQFIGMLNFCDMYSGDRAHYFMLAVDTFEVGTGLKQYRDDKNDLLKDSMVTTWGVDNGTGYITPD